MEERDELFNYISAPIEGLGLKLVDLCVSRHKESTQVSAVVYKKEGTGIDDCSKAHRLIQEKLELYLPGTEFSLETSSPGTSRTIRNPREYAIFVGRGVRVFMEDEDFLEGKIVSSDGEKLIVLTALGETSVNIGSIRKAKLDYSQESR